MRLGVRVTVIVFLACAGLALGLAVAGLKIEEWAERGRAEAAVADQDALWRALLEKAVQRLEADVRVLAVDSRLASAAGQGDPAQVAEAVALSAEVLRNRADAPRVEVGDRDGVLLYGADGAVAVPSLRDVVVGDGQPVRGLLRDLTGSLAVTLALPLRDRDGPAGLVVLAADSGPLLLDFKALTGADVFLLDRDGRLVQGTDAALWPALASRFSARAEPASVWGEVFSSQRVVVSPVRDGFGRVAGALVGVRAMVAVQTGPRLIGQAIVVGVAAFVALMLGIAFLTVRRGLRPLDQVGAALDALSRGDGSSALEAGDRKDEIGRAVAAVAVFRDEALAQSLRRQSRNRRRRRQILFLRLQMLNLSELLDEAQAAVILADLRRIDALIEREAGDGDDRPESERDELEILGATLQTLAERLAERQQSLLRLVAERTREMAMPPEPAGDGPPPSLQDNGDWSDDDEAGPEAKGEPAGPPPSGALSPSPVALPVVVAGRPVVAAGMRPRVRVVPAPAAPPPVAAAVAPPDRMEVSVANDLAEIARLAGLVEDFVAIHQLPARLAFDLNLCLDEVIGNIVSYGYDDHDHHDIRVVVRRDQDVLVSEITDDGREGNPLGPSAEPEDGEDMVLGGQGVFLVQEFMDRTAYRREGGRNVVTLYKDIAASGSEREEPNRPV